MHSRLAPAFTLPGGKIGFVPPGERLPGKWRFVTRYRSATVAGSDGLPCIRCSTSAAFRESARGRQHSGKELGRNAGPEWSGGQAEKPDADQVRRRLLPRPRIASMRTRSLLRKSDKSCSLQTSGSNHPEPRRVSCSWCSRTVQVTGITQAASQPCLIVRRLARPGKI